MAKPTESFSGLHSKSIDAALRLTQLSLDNSKRIVDLQVETARALLEDSVKGATALTETRDPQAAMALRSKLAQETAQRMMAAARQMGELSAATQAEFQRMAAEQMAGSSQEIMEAFQKFVGAFPGANPGAMSSMQQAFDIAKNAFDQIARASTAAFGGMSEQAGKHKK